MRQEINKEAEQIDFSRPILPLAPTTKREKLFSLPNSPASNMGMELLGQRDDKTLILFKERKNTLGHKNTFDVLANKNKRQIVATNNGDKITVEIDDINKLAGSSKTAKKLYVFAFIEANKQALLNGELVKSQVRFPIQSLVDIGFYKQVQSARRGFKQGLDVLTSVKVKGTAKKGKDTVASNTASSAFRLEVIFTGGGITGNECTIELNPNLNWKFLASFFTVLPSWYFALPNKASDLLYHIFYLARQNTEKLQDKGYFDISFRSIQQRLSLPSEEGNANPDRTIKEPILQAIDDIEIEYNNYNKSNKINVKEPELAFQIMHYRKPIEEVETPDGAKTLSIQEFLGNCYLRVSLKGDYLSPLLEVYKDQQRQIQAALHRKERIIDQAKAINTAKTMEASKEKGNRTE